ncbi:MAG: hypothetical protein FWC27_11030 [Firmicutes bacterium]|nr:hypothetical protein [Bacillota bacterium]
MKKQSIERSETMLTYDVIQAYFACHDALTRAMESISSTDAEVQEKNKPGIEALADASKQLLAHEIGRSVVLAFAKECRLETVGDLCACRDVLLSRHADDVEDEDNLMDHFDVGPVEELGNAKSAIARVLDSFQHALPSEEARRLKLAYHGLDGVQAYFFNN